MADCDRCGKPAVFLCPECAHYYCKECLDELMEITKIAMR